jgi:pyruvate,water dikinase
LAGADAKVEDRDFCGVRIVADWSLLTEEEAEVAWKAYAQEKVEKSADNRLVGVVASVGDKNIMTATATIVMDPHTGADFPKGNILVAPMTSPDYVMLMRKASAVVTDTGGITSHAAIVSRELGIPCIVGTKLATQVIKDGDEVVVDTDNGLVEVKR